MTFILRELQKAVSNGWLIVLSIVGAFGFLSAFHHSYEFSLFVQIAKSLTLFSHFLWIDLFHIPIAPMIAELLTILTLSVFMFMRGRLLGVPTVRQWFNTMLGESEDEAMRLLLTTFVAIATVLAFYAFEVLWTSMLQEVDLDTRFNDIAYGAVLMVSALLIIAVTVFFLFYYPRVFLAASVAAGLILAMDAVLHRFADTVVEPVVDRVFAGAYASSRAADGSINGHRVVDGQLDGRPAIGPFRVRSPRGAQLRAEPGMRAPVLTAAPHAARVNVLGLSQDGAWVAVEYERGSRTYVGFIHRTLLLR